MGTVRKLLTCPSHFGTTLHTTYMHVYNIHFSVCIGDCIGLPLASTRRFPVIPTYGLHELTGWIASDKVLLDFQAHPVGSLFVRKPKYALSRALLKITKAHDTPEGSLDRIYLQLLPVFGPSIITEYTVELTEGFDILVNISVHGSCVW